MMIEKENRSMGRISVIVPAYNIEGYIGRCIESIINQTYQDIEIIIVDDGSTDNTGKIIDEYQAPNIKIIHQKNQGVSIARLNGLREAQGEWIGFVDGDDLIEPTMYEKLIINAYSHDAQISHCGYQIVYSDRTTFYYNSKQKIIYNSVDGIRALLQGELFEPSLCNKLYKCSLFEKVPKEKIELENIRNMEDMLLNYYLFKYSDKTVFEDLCLYHYIKREGSASNGKFSKRIWEDILRVFYILKDEEQDEKNIAIINSRIAAWLIRMALYERKEDVCLINAKERLKMHLNCTGNGYVRYCFLGYLVVYFPSLYEKVYTIYSIGKRMRHIKGDFKRWMKKKE